MMVATDTALSRPQQIEGANFLNLLIVDDDRAVREACRAVAQSLGFTPQVAESAEQAAPSRRPAKDYLPSVRFRVLRSQRLAQLCLCHQKYRQADQSGYHIHRKPSGRHNRHILRGGRAPGEKLPSECLARS